MIRQIVAVIIMVYLEVIKYSVSTLAIEQLLHFSWSNWSKLTSCFLFKYHTAVNFPLMLFLLQSEKLSISFQHWRIKLKSFSKSRASEQTVVTTYKRGWRVEVFLAFDWMVEVTLGCYWLFLSYKPFRTNSNDCGRGYFDTRENIFFFHLIITT